MLRIAGREKFFGFFEIAFGIDQANLTSLRREALHDTCNKTGLAGKPSDLRQGPPCRNLGSDGIRAVPSQSNVLASKARGDVGHIVPRAADGSVRSSLPLGTPESRDRPFHKESGRIRDGDDALLAATEERMIVFRVSNTHHVVQ